MRRRRIGAWLQPLLFADQVEDVSVPEEIQGQAVTALADVLLSAARDGSEAEGGGGGDESQDPA